MAPPVGTGVVPELVTRVVVAPAVVDEARDVLATVVELARVVEVADGAAAPGMHWLYHSLVTTQLLPEAQQVAPVQPLPPH